MAKPIIPRFLISPSKLASTLDIPVARIHALANAGYLCKVPCRDLFRKGDDYYHIVRSRPLPKNLPVRVVDRASILLWLMGLDVGRTFPVFDIYIEMELQRIAKLPMIQRTEQAIKMLRRYRDAEEIVAALAKAGSNNVAAAEIKRLGKGYKMEMLRLAGLGKNVGRPNRPGRPGRPESFVQPASLRSLASLQIVRPRKRR